MDEAHKSRLFGDVVRFADAGWLPPVYRGVMHAILAARDCEQGRFELCRRRGKRAQEFFRAVGSSQGNGLVELQVGISAMAQGRVQEAASALDRVEFLPIAQPVLLELRIERNGKDIGRATIGSEAGDPRPGPDFFGVQAAAHSNRAEAAFESGGPAAAVEAVAASLAEQRDENQRTLRLLSAQCAFWLVRAGEIGAASRLWKSAALPESSAAVLDLSQQTWREMEAVACARVALLDGVGDYASARELAANLRVSAKGFGLKRTLMRCLAIWSALEHRTANPKDAQRCLLEYLDEYRHSGYSRPLVREGKAGVAVLRELLSGPLESGLRPHAVALLKDIDSEEADDDSSASLEFSDREIEIIRGLAKGRRNKEIARALNLTESGVRYHLKRIYRALDASGRVDAMRRASQLGIPLGSPDGTGG